MISGIPFSQLTAANFTLITMLHEGIYGANYILNARMSDQGAGFFSDKNSISKLPALPAIHSRSIYIDKAYSRIAKFTSRRARQLLR